jgi:hypothetical protein
MSFRRIQHSLVAAMALLALALPATAFGQTGQEGYNGPEGRIQESIAQTGGGGDDGDGPVQNGDSADEGSGALPFTGLDLALLLGGGGLLVTAGLGMRRIARGPDTA